MSPLDVYDSIRGAKRVFYDVRLKSDYGDPILINSKTCNTWLYSHVLHVLLLMVVIKSILTIVNFNHTSSYVMLLSHLLW